MNGAHGECAANGVRKLAVIGHPIDHSLSPRIHGRFAERAGLAVDYRRHDVTPQTLAAFMDRARNTGISGFNVTMPLKAEVRPYLAKQDDSVRRYRACNTVVRDADGWTGYNTDGEGFRLSLARAGFAAGGADTLILGAGGAARAVALALLDAGARVSLICRNPAKATGFENATLMHPGQEGRGGNADVPGVSDVEDMPVEPGVKGVLAAPAVSIVPWTNLWDAARGKALIVNATPLGMHGAAGDFPDFAFLDGLAAGAFVCDLIYAPRETRLLRAARERGIGAMNGLAHLVCQAAFSFGHFTGEMPTGETIDAVMAELEGMEAGSA